MMHKIINIALLIVVILLLLKGCEMQKDRDNLLTQMNTLKAGEKVFKTKILADSSTLSTQTQTILSQEEALKLGVLKLEGEIKKVQSQVRQLQDIQIRDIEVPFVPSGYTDTSGWYSKLKNGDTSRSICDSLIANSIIVPQRFSLEQKWYSIDGKVNKNGLLLDSFKIKNESSVTIGYRKYGFLNLKREPLIEIKNTNPYLSLSKVSNVVIKPNKSIFKSKAFWTGIGIFGGIYLHSKL
jgi:hypothetical protein